MKLVGLALAAVALAVPTSAGAANSVTITSLCNNVPDGCSTGWYRTPVTVSFSVSGSGLQNVDCPTTTISDDTTGTDVRCVVTFTDGTITGKAVTIKFDHTPPTASTIAAARGPDANGWYNHAVGVAVTGSDATSGIASCTSVTYSGPDSATASVSGTCTDNAGNVSAPKALALQYDATPPSVSPAPARAADANGWYNHAVAVAFQGTDAVSGIDSCTGGSYSGPDSGSASVGGTCRDKAGNVGSASFALRYDATPPAVTGAAADRGPDRNGWYNHALTVSYAGADATSGIASCDKVSYAKPDDASASVTGRCTDNAGNVSAAAPFAFKFDSTPPKLSKLTVTSADAAATLAWTASADVATLSISRARGSAAPVTLYDGRRITTFTDKKVQNGNRYAYAITAYDAAGNAAVEKGTATPSAPLLTPRRSAQVGAGATLRWRASPRATYYNVQLWLRGRKVLSTWPRGTSLRLPRLAPGTYLWLVWPGLGALSQHRYGPLIGKSSFVVKG